MHEPSVHTCGCYGAKVAVKLIMVMQDNLQCHKNNDKDDDVDGEDDEYNGDQANVMDGQPADDTDDGVNDADDCGDKNDSDDDDDSDEDQGKVMDGLPTAG